MPDVVPPSSVFPAASVFDSITTPGLSHYTEQLFAFFLPAFRSSGLVALYLVMLIIIAYIFIIMMMLLFITHKHGSVKQFVHCNCLYIIIVLIT